MGCDESITMEDRPITMKTPQQQSQGATTRPITIEKKMTGLLEKDLHFQDCLIQSENDLENKIRMFIPTKKPDENNPEQLVPNIQDDIVTNSYQVDFDKYCVIAMSAINITNVSEVKGCYLVYHDNQAKSSGTYCAVVVERLPCNPEIKLASPKPTPTD